MPVLLNEGSPLAIKHQMVVYFHCRLHGGHLPPRSLLGQGRRRLVALRNQDCQHFSPRLSLSL